jgi:hypothetical protein
MNNPILLTSFYAGNIQYYSKLVYYKTCITDIYQHYEKQTFRNRCTIATANGRMDLIIPIVKGSDGKTIDKDIKIANDNWQKIHWGALESAYRHSPFFMYYEDDIRPFYQQRYTYLVDFNEALQACICDLVGISPTCLPNDSYIAATNNPDFRRSLHPKHTIVDKNYNNVPYYQVFEQKYGFIPNLSIFDLLFNMGNESVLILKKSFAP